MLGLFLCYKLLSNIEVVSELLVPDSYLSCKLVLQLNAVRAQTYRQITRVFFFFAQNNGPALLYFCSIFMAISNCQERQEILLKHKKKYFYLLKHRVVTQTGCGVSLLTAIQNPEQCLPADPALSSKVGLENSPEIPSSLSYSVVL